MPLNFQTVTPPLAYPVTLALLKTQCEIDAGFTGDDQLLQLYVAAATSTLQKLAKRAFFPQVWQRTLDNFPLAASFDYTLSAADRWNWPVYGGMWNRLTIDLPGGRCAAIVSVGYTDSNGNPQTLAADQYNADLTSVPCRLIPANPLVWPWQGSYLPGSVQIQYQVGEYFIAASETFTLPNGSSQYVLKQTPAVGLTSVTQGGAPVTGCSIAVAPATGVGTLTVPEGSGPQMTVNYSVGAAPADLQVAVLMLAAHFYRNREASSDLSMKDLPFGVESLIAPFVIHWSDYRPV